MKSLKLLFVFSLLFLFSSNTAYAVIEPKLFVKDTIIGTQDDSICIKEINKTAKSALYVGTVFLAPASFLSSTFLIFKNVFSNSLVLNLVKSATIASLGIFLLGIISYFIYKHKLKTRSYNQKRYPFWEKIMSTVVLSIGLVSMLSVFFFSFKTLIGLGFILKVLNFFTGLLLTILGIALLVGDAKRKKQ